MYTIRDHAKKLELHLRSGGALDANAGPYGSAEEYAARLEKSFFKLQDLYDWDFISYSNFIKAEDCVRRPFELYRAAKHGGDGKIRTFDCDAPDPSLNRRYRGDK